MFKIFKTPARLMDTTFGFPLRSSAAPTPRNPDPGPCPQGDEGIFFLVLGRRWKDALAFVKRAPRCTYLKSDKSQGRTPLHLICKTQLDESERGGALAVSRALVEASHSIEPSCIAGSESGGRERLLHNSVLTVKDHSGNTPLHCVCGAMDGGCLDLARMILNGTSDHIEGRKRRGCPPRRRKDGRALPSVHDLLGQKNDHGCTPLHFIADGNTDGAIVKLILDAEAAIDFSQVSAKDGEYTHPGRVFDDDGDTPLHYVYASNPFSEDPQLFLSNWSPCLEYRNVRRRTPIHELIDYSADLENVAAFEGIIKAGGDPIQKIWERVELLLRWHHALPDPYVEDRGHHDRGWFPLHVAADALHFHPAVFEMASSRCGKDAMLAVDEQGCTPLHHAVTSLGALTVPLLRYPPHEELEKLKQVKYLINCCPQALRVRSGAGRLPLHEAIYHGCRWNHIAMLLRAAPDTISDRQTTPRCPGGVLPSGTAMTGGGLLPFMVAAVDGSESELDTVYKLVLLDPGLIRDSSS